MSRLLCRLSAVAIFSTLATGCGLVQTTKEASRDSMKMFRPKPDDYRNTTEEAEDEWSRMGESARSMRPTEKNNDPLRNILLSPKARSIERNLGVD